MVYGRDSGHAATLEGTTADDALNGSDGADTVLDLTAIPDLRLSGFEVIDLGDPGNHAVHLDLRDLLALSDSATLRIDGGSGDTVSTADLWTPDPGGATVIGGQSYDVYVQGIATLLVHQDLDQSGTQVV